MADVLTIPSLTNGCAHVYGVNATLVKFAAESDLCKAAMSPYKEQELENCLYSILSPNTDDIQAINTATQIIKKLWTHQRVLGPYPLIETLEYAQCHSCFYEGYRDHLIHQIKVFLLGIYIYEKFPDSIAKAINKEIGLHEKEGKQRFIRRWLAASLFHDVGYVLESEKTKDTGDFWKKIQEGFSLAYKAPISCITDKINEKREMDIASRLNIPHEWNYSFSRIGVITENRKDIDLLGKLESYAQSSLLGNISQNGEPLLRRFLNFAKKIKPKKRPSFWDHGIISAAFLLESWTNYKSRLDSFSNEAQLDDSKIKSRRKFLLDLNSNTQAVENDIIAAAGAIALHNINLNAWETNQLTESDFEVDLYRLMLNDRTDEELPGALPLAFLLGLTDTLQCWDRCQFNLPDSNSEQNSISGNELHIEAYNDKLCLWFSKDAKRFHNPSGDDGYYNLIVNELKEYLEERAIADLIEFKYINTIDSSRSFAKATKKKNKNTKEQISPPNQSNVRDYVCSIVVFDFQDFSTLDATEQKNAAQDLWKVINNDEYIQENEANDKVSWNGTGDGGLVTFKECSFSKVIEFTNTVIEASKVNGTKLRAAIHYDLCVFTKIDSLGKSDQILGKGPNEASRLVSLGDPYDIIVSEDFAQKWYAVNHDEAKQALYPSIEGIPLQVFIKHGIPQALRIYTQNSMSSSQEHKMPEQIKRLNDTNRHIDALLEVIEKGVIGYLINIKQSLNRDKIDARISILSPKPKSEDSSFLESTGFRYHYKDYKTGKGDTVYRWNSEGTDEKPHGPAGVSFSEGKIVCVRNLPDPSKNKAKYINVLHKEWNIPIEVINQFSRKARTFVEIPFGLTQSENDLAIISEGMICIDIMNPLRWLKDEELCYLAKSLFKSYNVTLASLWRLRLQS